MVVFHPIPGLRHLDRPDLILWFTGALTIWSLTHGKVWIFIVDLVLESFRLLNRVFS